MVLVFDFILSHGTLYHKGFFWLCIQEYHVTEKKEEQPTAMNAFELISMSRGLNLENLFDVEQVCNFIL
jgi:hypothetical protein